MEETPTAFEGSPTPTRRPTSAAAEEILGGYFPVLDHGFVALVDYMGDDASVERAARVSYGYGTRKVSMTRGLLRYLRRHLHTTPSEMVELCFHCSMPIFVARQWVRHRTACLAEGTDIHFDLPGAEERGRRQLYKLRIEEIWRRFQPTRNATRPDKQGNPFFRRDRVKRMRLRQANENTLALQHTRIVDVYRNGVKPVFRMVLEDGKSIEATADHRFLFAGGWDTLRGATGLRETGGRAVWRQGDYFVQVNGAAEKRPERYRDPTWLQREYRGHKRSLGDLAEACVDRAKLVRVAHFEYVGERDTYDLEVEGPHHNFVANGIVTHNSVNEYSGRYSLMPLLFYNPRREHFALQSGSSNQGRAAGDAGTELYAEAVRRWEAVRSQVAADYGWLAGENVARELARIDLPLSTYTQWYWKIDLHNLLHFLTLRVDEHAQWEIREYGRVIAAMVKRVAPISYEAWIDYQVMGDRLSHGELRALARLVAADEGGVAARPEARLSDAELGGLGLSKREVRELKGKLAPRDVPDFELDTSRMRSPEEVAAEALEAVPRVPERQKR